MQFSVGVIPGSYKRLYYSEKHALCSHVLSPGEAYDSWSKREGKLFPPYIQFLLFIFDQKLLLHTTNTLYDHLNIQVFMNLHFFLDIIDNFMEVYMAISQNHFKPDNSFISFIDFSNLTIRKLSSIFPLLCYWWGR